MTALDIFVILLLGGGAVIGFVRGFVHEVLSLLAWVVAIVDAEAVPHADQRSRWPTRRPATGGRGRSPSSSCSCRASSS